jgi:hypothetical protein
MTKEWYERTQNINRHLWTRASKKAEVFSEDYFRELYRREEKNWLKRQKEIAKFQKVDLDPELERECFAQIFQNDVQALKDTLPKELLDKIADVRVLALYYATEEVKEKLVGWCEQNEKIMRETPEAYWREFEKQFGENAPAFIKELNLHDCEVQSCERIGQDVVLHIDNEGGFTDIREIRMKNCEVLMQDAPLSGARCLYEEIYRTGERFEIHFLMQQETLIDYIVRVDDLEYQSL